MPSQRRVENTSNNLQGPETPIPSPESSSTCDCIIASLSGSVALILQQQKEILAKLERLEFGGQQESQEASAPVGNVSGDGGSATVKSMLRDTCAEFKEKFGEGFKYEFSANHPHNLDFKKRLQAILYGRRCELAEEVRDPAIFGLVVKKTLQTYFSNHKRLSREEIPAREKANRESRRVVTEIHGS